MRLFPTFSGLRFAGLGWMVWAWAVVASAADSPIDRAEKAFVSARGHYDSQPAEARTAWQFARAAFDWAEFAKNNKQREATALDGIAAARHCIELEPDSVAGHYYLGMNLGQLARTKSLGALRLVEEMERVFKKARELDENFDFAGPDRNLGLLYLEAPSFSVGDRKKARVHLLRAVELRPDYPDNHLNLIEAYFKWGDKRSARQQLQSLKEIWDKAKLSLEGEPWETAWTDWNRRLRAVEQQLAK